ncbi:hypothetical protein PUN28_001911 [Cardiocondyla obscurior]|uniref:Uncharacterized protein n=1 Tax=Cardiocondyla obscurior TaxID=286306 RepID=A0AAW2GRT3_9HYME
MIINIIRTNYISKRDKNLFRECTSYTNKYNNTLCFPFCNIKILDYIYVCIYIYIKEKKMHEVMIFASKNELTRVVKTINSTLSNYTQ